MRPPPPRRSPAMPLLLSAAGHALLVAVLTLIPLPRDEEPACVDTEVHDGPILSLADLPEPRPPLPRPAEPQESPDEHEFPVEVIPPPPDDGPSSPTPGAGAQSPSLPGPSASSPLAGPAGRGSLAVPASARSVVYLLDRSASMGLHGALDVGREEVLGSLSRLRPGTLFQVIPYHREPDPLLLDGRVGLVPVGPGVYQQAGRFLADLRPSGSTDQVKALLRGLALRPDVLFLVTDADDLTAKDLATVTALNRGQTSIHVVELTCRLHPRSDSPLQRLAAENRGTCRRVLLAE